MKDLFLRSIGLVTDVAVMVSMVGVIKASIALKGLLGKAATSLGNVGKRVGGKAEDAVNNSKMGQRRQMEKDFRKTEKKRAATLDYANRIQEDSGRGKRLRRRAAGGITGGLIGKIRPGYNQAGQDRASIQGLRAVTQFEEQETKDAKDVMDFHGITNPADMKALALGQSVASKTQKDAQGNAVMLNGAGNAGLQRAGVRGIITAGDADQLQNLWMSSGMNQSMLANEIGRNYPTAKGAGAHLVKMAPKMNNAPYTQQEVEDKAFKEISVLKFKQMASQDGASAKFALEGYKRAHAAGTNSVERAKMLKAAQEIKGNALLMGEAKDETRELVEWVVNNP